MDRGTKQYQEKKKKPCPKKDTTRKDTLCMRVLQQYLRRNALKEEQQNVV